MRSALVVVLLATLGPASAAAQDRSDVELTRQQIQTERQAIVGKNLPLTEQQSAAFWPLHREYRGALAPAGDRYVALLTDYAGKYGSLTNSDADAMMKEFFAIQNERQKTQFQKGAARDAGGAVLPDREQARRHRQLRPGQRNTPCPVAQRSPDGRSTKVQLRWFPEWGRL